MDQVRVFLRKLFRGVGSARAKRLERLVERNEWALLQQETLSDPSVYRHAEVFRKDALVCNIVRKLLLPGDQPARRAAAVDTFFQSERECAATNARLSRFVNLQGPFEARDEPLITFISSWRREVHRVLGKPPVLLTPRFSGGSTLSDSGKRVTIPDKLTSEPTFYASGRGFNIDYHLNGTPFFLKPVSYRRGNKFFTVPKDSQKDRGCCVEASLAVALQLDAGEAIVRRVEKAYQVDMAQAPDYHKWLAQLASRLGTFATIDLSNASDTVARRLVELLLPDDWYAMLNSLRARTTAIEGKVVYLEKFSSMGNGFTFPLETLLFRTLCAAVGSHCASVFGDDIIIETEHAKDLLAALRFFGFTPNAKKTFCEGPFRESCGGDYFEGQAVRPHFLKELPTEPQHWVALANGLRRADPNLRYAKAAWRFCVDQLPTDWRNFTADQTLGDLAVYDPAAEPQLRFQAWPEDLRFFGRRVGDERLCWKVKVPFYHTFRTEQHFDLLTVMVAGALGCGEEISPRESVAGYRTQWVATLS